MLNCRVFIGTQKFENIFKSALVYLSWGIKFPQQNNINQSEIELVIRICQWNCCQSWKAVARRCSVKKVFLFFVLNSQENTCARVCLLTKLQTLGLKFKKFLRTPFIIGHLWWLLPNLFQKTYYSECALWIFMLMKLFL